MPLLCPIVCRVRTLLFLTHHLHLEIFFSEGSYIHSPPRSLSLCQQTISTAAFLYLRVPHSRFHYRHGFPKIRFKHRMALFFSYTRSLSGCLCLYIYIYIYVKIRFIYAATRIAYIRHRWGEENVSLCTFIANRAK